MIKKLTSYLREFRTASILTPILAGLEVVMETLLPMMMAGIIDKGITPGNLNEVYKYGAIMIVMAIASLSFGVAAGRLAARASAGFAANVRTAMYDNIQTFAFKNIDKFSTSGLVTRMTTDVTNCQNAFQMILRIAVRAPLTFLLSMVMCLIKSFRLSLIFLVAVVFLGCALGLIVRMAMKRFSQVFEKYDDLNASVQENVTGIRVVKAFVREDYETGKLKKASGNIYRLFSKAERMVILNAPLMQITVYTCILLISSSTSDAVPPLSFMINPQCFSETLTPPHRSPARPESMISLPAKYPSGLLNTEPQLGYSSGCLLSRRAV